MVYMLSWSGDGYCRDALLNAESDDDAIKQAEESIKNCLPNTYFLFNLDKDFELIWQKDI